MARSTLQVLEILQCCVRRGINVHIVKLGMVLDDSIVTDFFNFFVKIHNLQLFSGK
jgi:hypothetical protein